MKARFLLPLIASMGACGDAALQERPPAAETPAPAAPQRMEEARLALDTLPDARESRPPNFILIFVDDLGYGDLSGFGHPTIRTPNLDRMAAQGVRLTSFYVGSPACTPSRAALLTGRYPSRSGMHHVLGPESQTGLPASEITLAEALGSAGYHTAIIGKWHLGGTPGFFPTDHGFDSFFGLLYSNDMMPPWVQTERPLELWRDTDPVEHPVDQTTLTKRYTEEAVSLIRQWGEEPFFLYLAHSMPHVPLHASESFRGSSAAGTYGDVIEELDWSAGEILAVLEEEGLSDRTLVVFTSDNGPWSEMPERMFGEDIVKPWDAGTVGPFRGTKHSTYEGGLRVPFVAWWPGRIPPGRTSSAVATAMDVFPTFLAYAGLALRTERRIDGEDIGPLLAAGAPSPHALLFYHRNDHLEAVRDGTWKLRVTRAAEEEPPQWELYDLTHDPYERFNLATDHPDIVARLRDQMAAFADSTGVLTWFQETR